MTPALRVAGLLLVLLANAALAEQTLLLRDPALSADRLAFVYAGDLWIANRDGKVLYFAPSTNSGPLQVGLNMTSRERPYRAGLYAAVLEQLDGFTDPVPDEAPAYPTEPGQ